ncbi:MAG: hypothetical protein C0606_15980 [Hyphomicrobiales bacterium]|nr:MAG: hypothetical protein C0606_15980 [Hyphomicrobiales bacterium]
MVETQPKNGRRQWRTALAAALVCSFGLAACGGGDEGPRANSFAGKLLRGTSEDVKTIDTEKFGARPPCPPLAIRTGTQTHVIYDRGRDGDPEGIRFQATITETARDCKKTATGELGISVGVAGRVLAGPRGGGGEVKLPVRIVVVEPNAPGGEDRVVYSQLHQIPVTVSEAAPSVLWTKVDDSIVVPLQQGFKIFVGFDSRGKK